MRHLLGEHEDEEEDWARIEFGMKIIKTTRTAFERQILESVTIQKERRHHLMNSKSEYNRCALPRLTARLGEKDLEKWREEDREEMEKEATIEEKIRQRKKKRSMERAEQTRRREQGQPKKKKMKLDKECAGDKGKEENRETRTTTPTKKRKVARCEERIPALKRRDNQSTGTQMQPAKKMRVNQSTGSHMRQYITCKKWREEQEIEHRAQQKKTSTPS